MENIQQSIYPKPHALFIYHNNHNPGVLNPIPPTINPHLLHSPTSQPQAFTAKRKFSEMEKEPPNPCGINNALKKTKLDQTSPEKSEDPSECSPKEEKNPLSLVFEIDNPCFLERILSRDKNPTMEIEGLKEYIYDQDNDMFDYWQLKDQFIEDYLKTNSSLYIENLKKINKAHLQISNDKLSLIVDANPQLEEVWFSWTTDYSRLLESFKKLNHLRMIVVDIQNSFSDYCRSSIISALASANIPSLEKIVFFNGHINMVVDCHSFQKAENG